MWRVRALGRGARRVERLRGRAGCPLQAALAPDGVYVVDAAVCVFVWVGHNASEEDETLSMQLAHLYAQRLEPPVQVSPVLAGSEPDEFRRLFHSWGNVPIEADWIGKRHDKLRRRLGLSGKVLRAKVWPGSEAAPAFTEAGEEVVSSGLVLFGSSCGIVRSTAASASARTPPAGWAGGGAAEAARDDLAAEPAEGRTLRLLLAAMRKTRPPPRVRASRRTRARAPRLPQRRAHRRRVAAAAAATL